MITKNKIVLAHRGQYNSQSHNKYRDNSIEVCKVSSQKDFIDIIELDIRKSKDGILYCYHGNLWEYLIALKIPKQYQHIKHKYQADKLVDVVDAIDTSKIIFLDIKDKRISKNDILSVFKDKKHREIILGNKSVAYLNRFYDMSERFVKIMIGNIFCKFYCLKKLKQKGYKYFEVLFPFQISKKIIQRATNHGLGFRCASQYFLSKKHYQRVIDKYNIKHVTSSFID